uniref:Uncharacterized protein n=1 Tax=Arundo donax TaxID=35708 RepID=A0A0A8Z2T6_ARUDO
MPILIVILVRIVIAIPIPIQLELKTWKCEESNHVHLVRPAP